MNYEEQIVCCLFVVVKKPIESRTSIGGLLPGIFPTCSWDIFGHESRLDQSDASKNI